MSQASKILLIVLLSVVAGCGRHKSPAPNQPAVPPAVPARVPEPPPQVNEPPPVVHMDSGVQTLFSGDLHATQGLQIRGTVALMKSDEGYAIRLEHLRIDGEAPTLDVILSRKTSIGGTAETGDALTLGEVKGATGNMNYPLQAGVDPSAYHTVALVARGTGQIVATASLGLM